jgi:hypothetical protein
MLKSMFVAFLPLLLVFGNGPVVSSTGPTKPGPQGNTGTLQKMIVANGNVSMNLDLSRLNGAGVGNRLPKAGALRFEVQADSFFTILVFNDELRGPLPSSMALIPQDSPTLPGRLSTSYQQLMIEHTAWGGQYDLVIRDAKTGFTFFNIEGYSFAYEPTEHRLSTQTGRVLLSPEFAAELGRAADAGSVLGTISISANMRPIEISQIVDGEVKSADMPSLRNPESGSVPGPDVIVGDLSGLAQFNGATGTQVGLAVGTDSCNFGAENLHWFRLPDNDHPVIPQNLYRMSGGATNDERFEQIGQSNVKHAFTALTNNICGLGCNGVGGANLGSGCSDPYDAGLNAGPQLGSRAWINPFTGAYPRGDSADNPNNHSGHSHPNTAHKILTEIADLNTSLNPGATYYAESQYITPHEYVWCQSHPGQCNMNNNVSYRRYSVSGTGSPFSFSPVGATQRQKTAITAWTGATMVPIQPDPGNDGIGVVAYKVTNPSAGVWHYEYAIYNQNMDRAIRSFSVAIGAGVTLSNVGFHAPPQQPGWTFDGTLNNAGFSNAPWTQTSAGGFTSWSAETLAQNPNANAIRWGTLYNVRFDSNRPPTTVDATIGFFKTGAPMTIQVQGPTPAVAQNFQVSGRVFNASGNPIRGASVVLDDGAGHTQFAFTSPLGFYVFNNVTGGVTYTLSVSSKRYSFNPVQITVNSNLADQDLTALPK